MNATVDVEIISNKKTKNGFMQCGLTTEPDGNRAPVMILTRKERSLGEVCKITGRVGNFMNIDSLQEA